MSYKHTERSIINNTIVYSVTVVTSTVGVLQAGSSGRRGAGGGEPGAGVEPAGGEGFRWPAPGCFPPAPAAVGAGKRRARASRGEERNFRGGRAAGGRQRRGGGRTGSCLGENMPRSTAGDASRYWRNCKGRQAGGRGQVCGSRRMWEWVPEGNRRDRRLLLLLRKERPP